MKRPSPAQRFKWRKNMTLKLKEKGKGCVFADGDCMTWLPLQLTHIIRVSESWKWEMVEENCMLACQLHHHIFDNDNRKRWDLKNIDVVLQRMKELDEKDWVRMPNLTDKL